jgi:two-component sensor histidine kinase
MDALLVKEQVQHTSPAVAEANHRIANSLTLLVSMLRMQAQAAARSSEPYSGADVRLLLEGVAARIGTISQLHRLLSHEPAEGAASLKPHLQEVCDVLVSTLSSPERPCTVELSGCDCLVLTRQVQPLILILCEVFINAMKYAHPTGVGLRMAVVCGAASDGRMTLTISDDGVGLPENFDLAKDGGFGFRVIRGLAAEIGASLEIVSPGIGLSFRLLLPAMAGGKLS